MDKKRNDRLTQDNLDGWVSYCAELLYYLHRAGILEKLHELSDNEIDTELDKISGINYHSQAMQAPRVAPEKPSSNVGLVSVI